MQLYIQDIVKEVAQLQKNGRYVNKYHLRDMYRVGMHRMIDCVV